MKMPQAFSLEKWPLSCTRETERERGRRNGKCCKNAREGR